VDWLASFIALRVAGAVFVVFPRRWRKNLHNSPANGKQGSIPGYAVLVEKVGLFLEKVGLFWKKPYFFSDGQVLVV
jgi:hypothetical protein